MRPAGNDQYKRIRTIQGEQRFLYIQAEEGAHLLVQSRPTVRFVYIQRSVHEPALQGKPSQLFHP